MPSRLPSLESLRVFEVCARLSNFSHAAAELSVTPAAVSLRIRDLEKQLGFSLFDRHGPKVTPNRAGASLARKLAINFASISDAIAEASTTIPALRITAVPTIAAMWLAPRLGRYQARSGAAPIKLDVSTDVRPNGAFDVAIRSGRGVWPGLRAVSLFPIEAAPMLSPALAASVKLETPADLLRLPLLADGRWCRWFGEAGETRADLPQIGVEYPSQDLAATAAAASNGVALLSPTCFASMLADGRLVQAFETTIRGPEAYSALVAESETRTPVLDFVDWLTSEALPA